MEIECLYCLKVIQIPERIDTNKKYKGEFTCSQCGARLYIKFTGSADKDSSQPAEYKGIEKGRLTDVVIKVSYEDEVENAKEKLNKKIEEIRSRSGHKE